MTRRLRSLKAVLLAPRRLAAIERRLARTEARLKRQDERLRRQRQRLDATNRKAKHADGLVEILSSQLGGIEVRLQSLTELLDREPYAATDEEQTQARNLLEEIRDEHRRIRVRFGVVARYEERLRRLESALAEEMVAAAALAREAALNGVVAGTPSAGAVVLPDEAADREP
jgi:hypothetical protein